MLRATSIVRRPAVKADKVADTLTLDHQARHRRRLAMTGEGGLSFLLDLDRSVALDDGDAVKLEDGRLVRVAAAPERLIEVTTDNPLRLMRVAWHLGNRHVATEIAGDALYLAHDHVLFEMVRGLGAVAREVLRPFRPERGAYEGEDGHGSHSHASVHDHAATHGHDHAAHAAHDHAHAAHGDHHDHGAACGCGHDHGPHHHHEDLRPAHRHDGAAGHAGEPADHHGHHHHDEPGHAHRHG